MPPTIPSPSSTRVVEPLTGLRFVAALLVLLHHFPFDTTRATLQTMQQAGYYGVTLFFVLSGFVLTLNYLDAFERAPAASLGRFYVARFARIYPVYLLLLVVMWLREGATGPVVSHALLLQAWSGDPAHAFALNGPGWSLSVEAFLYATFPLLVVALARTGVLASSTRIALALVVVAAAMIALAVFFDVTGRNVASAGAESAHRWLFRSPASRLGDFLLGILAAVYAMRFAAQRPASRTIAGMATLAAIVAMLAFMAMPSNIDSTYSWDVLYAIPGVVLIGGLALAPQSLVGRALGTRVLVLLGESSYCLYLLQVPMGTLRIDGNPVGTAGGAWFHLGFIVLLVACAIALHLLFERPLQRAIREAYARRRERVADREPARRRRDASDRVL